MYRPKSKDTRTKADNNNPAQARQALFPDAATSRMQNTLRFRLLRQPEKSSLSSCPTCHKHISDPPRTTHNKTRRWIVLHTTLGGRNLTLKFGHLKPNQTILSPMFCDGKPLSPPQTSLGSFPLTHCKIIFFYQMLTNMCPPYRYNANVIMVIQKSR